MQTSWQALRQADLSGPREQQRRPMTKPELTPTTETYTCECLEYLYKYTYTYTHMYGTIYLVVGISAQLPLPLAINSRPTETAIATATATAMATTEGNTQEFALRCIALHYVALACYVVLRYVASCELLLLSALCCSSLLSYSPLLTPAVSQQCFHCQRQRHGMTRGGVGGRCCCYCCGYCCCCCCAICYVSHVVAVDFYINFCHIATRESVRHMSTATMHSDSSMTFSTFS